MAITKRKAGAVDQSKRAAIAEELARLQSRQALSEKAEREKRALAEWRSSEREKQSQGKTPFYLKQGENVSSSVCTPEGVCRLLLTSYDSPCRPAQETSGRQTYGGAFEGQEEDAESSRQEEVSREAQGYSQCSSASSAALAVNRFTRRALACNDFVKDVSYNTASAIRGPRARRSSRIKESKRFHRSSRELRNT